MLKKSQITHHLFIGTCTEPEAESSTKKVDYDGHSFKGGFEPTPTKPGFVKLNSIL